MATETRERFEISKVQRNKCLSWNPKGNAGKGAGVYTTDLLNDDGSVDMKALAECNEQRKAQSLTPLQPSDVVYITQADLSGDYRKDSRSAVAAYAKWANMSEQDAIWDLVISAEMQRLANESVRTVRPVTDKSKDRAMSTLRKVLEAQGKTEAEIKAAFTALGITG